MGEGTKTPLSAELLAARNEVFSLALTSTAAHQRYLESGSEDDRREAATLTNLLLAAREKRDTLEK